MQSTAKFGRTHHAVGGNETIHATRTDVAEKTHLAGVDVCVGNSIKQLEHQVLAGDRVVASSAKPAPLDLSLVQPLAGEQVERGFTGHAGVLIEKGLSAEQHGRVAHDLVLPGGPSGLRMESAGLPAAAGQDQPGLGGVRHPIVPHKRGVFRAIGRAHLSRPAFRAGAHDRERKASRRLPSVPPSASAIPPSLSWEWNRRKRRCRRPRRCFDC